MTQIAFHALSVGGGLLALSALPGRGGDYAQDLEHIRDWKPSIVVSMTTLSEMTEFGAEMLGVDVRERAARWAHLPVADFGVPDEQVEKDWPKVAVSVLTSLRGGGRVLVHCMGGCGRSGMVALRLMIEAGEPVDLALGRLRAVRPCAVETDEQFEWAKKGRRRQLPRPGGMCQT